ncbi:hypothetical protein [Halomonas mongoliensis]|uniref:hypothetical protein n=1 Tax=Halomonas mongoliensis TaxID=321265 RepID=UPI00403AFE28
MTMDQASGLREWASQHQEMAGLGCPTHVAEALLALARGGPGQPRPGRQASAPAAGSPVITEGTATTLMVVGLPASQLGCVRELLAYWQAQGRRWVGDPRRWRLVPVSADSAHLPLLASQQPRWVLWVEADAEGFRRAWRLLLALSETGGPGQLLLMHPPGLGRRGLLENLQQAAAHYLGVELVVLA